MQPVIRFNMIPVRHSCNYVNLIQYSDYVLISERGTRLDRVNAGRIVKRAGEKAKLPLQVHPHMLRHATGYFLANNGHGLRIIQDYLGHRSVQHTVLYTRLVPERFKSLWE